jgi:hypothetical protein
MDCQPEARRSFGQGLRRVPDLIIARGHKYRSCVPRKQSNVYRLGTGKEGSQGLGLRPIRIVEKKL